MSNRCPSCYSENTKDWRGGARVCNDCDEQFDPTVDNGDMDEADREEWLPENEVDDTEHFPSAEWVEAEDVIDDRDFDDDEGGGWMDDDRRVDCDDSDDGQALASCGFGTDEDYGLHEDWFDERNDD
jgi:hypothetical protein